MGVNTDQLKRFFKIDDKIKHGKKATIKQLAAAWNNSRSDDVDKVTDRTIYTDINAIPKVFEGAKIEIIEGKYYSYEDHKFSIKQLNLNENDEVLLSLIRMTLQNYENTVIYDKFNKLKNKVLQEDKTAPKSGTRSTGSHAHHVPHIGWPQIAPVTSPITVNVNPTGAAAFAAKALTWCRLISQISEPTSIINHADTAIIADGTCK